MVECGGLRDSMPFGTTSDVSINCCSLMSQDAAASEAKCGVCGASHTDIFALEGFERVDTR